jgi:hypothetical protein
MIAKAAKSVLKQILLRMLERQLLNVFATSEHITEL